MSVINSTVRRYFLSQSEDNGMLSACQSFCPFDSVRSGLIFGGGNFKREEGSLSQWRKIVK